jgi:hypothetical protein
MFQAAGSDIVEQIKTFIKTSRRVVDNHDIAQALSLDPEFVEKVCMDIYDALVIEERLASQGTITLEELDQWLKDNDLV